MDFFSTSKSIGILGGGQLGKMLLYVTRKWDIKTYVLDPSEDSPARLSCNHFFKGDLTDFETVYKFGKRVDVLTIEIENVNVQALEKLEKEGVKVFPQSKIIKTIKNKCLQKEFYKKNQIPTSPFSVYKKVDQIKKDIFKKNLGFPFIWKSALSGYDGYGVKVINSIKDIELLPEGESLVEKFVNIKKELAVIVSRTENGELDSYPVLEMEFNNDINQVEYVLCPARIDEKISEKAKEISYKISENLNHVGLLVVELFLTDKGDVIVNEIAPRPHNSGHLTIEASNTCQFEQHIRAILNMPLGDTNITTPSVMVNLIGSKEFSGPVFYKNINQILAIDSVIPHIYGKKQTHPFRKMGHVTVLNSEIENALKIAKQIKKTIQVISK
ncbi:MAG: 5-(carboxyamino)imidazole ribonucleotide synthase [Bacteroidota bacterium]|nr:5-(carboxyamino)imidazole ribonucleotide synthase [Bacteroidota bacterium]